MGVVGGGGGFSFTLWGVGGLLVVVTYLFVICFFVSFFVSLLQGLFEFWVLVFLYY
jgi:TM2 domain-containing membrane protein YozV